KHMPHAHTHTHTHTRTHTRTLFTTLHKWLWFTHTHTHTHSLPQYGTITQRASHTDYAEEQWQSNMQTDTAMRFTSVPKAPCQKNVSIGVLSVFCMCVE